MKIILILILFLQFLFVPIVYAGKHCGPLWAVWTHSEDRDECRMKTIFWFAIGTASFVYLIHKTQESDKQKKLYPFIGIINDRNHNTIFTINFRF